MPEHRGQLALQSTADPARFDQDVLMLALCRLQLYQRGANRRRPVAIVLQQREGKRHGVHHRQVQDDDIDIRGSSQDRAHLGASPRQGEMITCARKEFRSGDLG